MEHKPGTFRTSIGGQALIEGILMRGPEKQAIVVRSPEGLVTKVEELTLIKDKYPILGLPILRGGPFSKRVLIGRGLDHNSLEYLKSTRSSSDYSVLKARPSETLDKVNQK